MKLRIVLRVNKRRRINVCMLKYLQDYKKKRREDKK